LNLLHIHAVDLIIFRSFKDFLDFLFSIGTNHFESKLAINIDVAPCVTAVLNVLPCSIYFILTRLIFKFINANNNDSFGLGNFNNEEVFSP
jgi:hypothetical protein